MENKELMKINPVNPVPEDERAVDTEKNPVVSIVKMDDNIIPTEERTEAAETIPDGFDTAIKFGVFSPVSDMGNLKEVFDDRIYAQMTETENGDRYLNRKNKANVFGSAVIKTIKTIYSTSCRVYNIIRFLKMVLKLLQYILK